MKASVSADKIDVLERDVDKTRIQIVRDRILEIRQRIVDVIIRKPKEEGENSTKSTGKDQKDVGDQRHRCRPLQVSKLQKNKTNKIAKLPN